MKKGYKEILTTIRFYLSDNHKTEIQKMIYKWFCILKLKNGPIQILLYLNSHF